MTVIRTYLLDILVDTAQWRRKGDGLKTMARDIVGITCTCAMQVGPEAFSRQVGFVRRAS